MASKKKSKSKKQAASTLESNEFPILELIYKEHLFQLLCHPEKPIILSGLSSGHIYCHEYDPIQLAETLLKNKNTLSKAGKSLSNQQLWTTINVEEDTDRNDFPAVKLLWKTRRHKGSVRAMAIDPEGEFFYSVGTDNILKKSVVETGKVIKKVSFPTQKSKFTKMLKSDTHPVLIIGDEDGTVHVLDSDNLQFKNKLTKVHNGDDAINDIFPFYKRSVHKYISLGQTTLGYWDCRESNESDFSIPEDDTETKRKVLLSDDQEDEILCGTFVDPEVADTVVCGMGEGILTVWKPNKNDLEDQLTRVKIAKNESIDCIVPTLQDDDCIWCGCSNGKLYKVDVKKGKIVEVKIHSELDEVEFIDLDYGYRLVSGGMESIKVWNFSSNGENVSNNENDDDLSSAEDSEAISDFEDSDDSIDPSSSKNSTFDSSELDDDQLKTEAVNEKETDDSSESISDSDDSDDENQVGMTKEQLIAELDKDIFGNDSDDDVRQNKKRKKETNKKLTKKQKKAKSDSTKQLQNHSNGIRKFEGL
ncbi:hypothetical protein TBLA_0F02990 [Henningerozyma blattae CBS 6284]|uniref:WD repeat-containing protein JIP5 n=1 Tax=Henningerozyma blattae (strain ATCC 34711 / CBS 6284 / DSM 70876 / NBRC 10599 / NRRL Y-10934 / UCD 77-7) TaxID=1071380 RepID=I2H636_HENB6|nr:hypothetical protein TBLA_0F02990 [Tetrapisispora blattae CBS 6284]CCH61838.1 hypothetical protein TBLA_0F02990 [Tetrapisispora blattae CBS 6284]